MSSNNSVQFVTPEQCARALAVCWKARVPLNLVGAPGVGKTSAVEAFVAKVQAAVPGFGYWPVILAMKGCEDFGLPAPAGGRLAYLFPPDLPVGDPKAKGLLFLDEWDRCPDAAVQNIAMQCTLGGNFHGTVLSKDVYTVLAMNGTSDIHTSPVSEAARTRMVHLYVGTGAPGYWNDFGVWAVKAGVPPEVAGFMRSRTDLIKAGEEFEELAAFNPRTGGALLARLCQALDSTKIKVSDIELPLFAGAVGYKAGVEFMAYRKVWRDLPDIDNVIRNPKTATVPDKAGLLFATAMALMGRVKGNGDLKAALVYIGRWPEEPGAFGARLIAGKHPEAVALPEYAKWAQVNL